MSHVRRIDHESGRTNYDTSVSRSKPMNPSFGPWATAAATGANPQLNTFGKRRLAMLSSLKESSSHLTGRAVLVLSCLAIGALAIPTLKWASGGPLAGLAKPTGSGSLVLLVDDNSDT